MTLMKNLALGLAMLAVAMPSMAHAKQWGTKTGGSWSSRDCNSTGCFYTYCKIDHTTDPTNGGGYGSAGGTSCYTIFIPIYAEAPAPE
ncbi:MAG: hypothetical protein V2I74_08550 [Erythrobacter sp.]|nr:hypothetical protein [Erythrobacter sp.]